MTPAWEKSWFATRDIREVCAYMAIGAEFSDRAQGIDNVYRGKEQWVDSNKGQYEPEQGHIYSLKPRFLSSPISAFEESANGKPHREVALKLLKPYFSDPEKIREIQNLRQSLAVRLQTETGEKLAIDTRDFIVCAAVANMGYFSRKYSDSALVGACEPSMEQLAAADTLERLPRQIADGIEHGIDFPANYNLAMQGYQLTFCEWFRAMRFAWKEVPAQIRFKAGVTLPPVFVTADERLPAKIADLARRGRL